MHVVKISLTVNLLDLLESLLLQPCTHYHFQHVRIYIFKVTLPWGHVDVASLFVLWLTCLWALCTERPATGSRSSSGSNPDHTGGLCGHTEPLGTGAALLCHAHSVQHRWMKTKVSQLKNHWRDLVKVKTVFGPFSSLRVPADQRRHYSFTCSGFTWHLVASQCVYMATADCFPATAAAATTAATTTATKSCIT